MVVYGASGHGKVIIDILESLEYKIDFIVDDNSSITDFMGYEVRRNTGEYDEVTIAIGNCQIRKKIAESLKVQKYVKAVHPSAIVSPRASIGDGTVVMHAAVIQTCAQVGEHCIINTGASVDHDCIIGDYVHIAPHATVAGGVEIGEGTWIGAGSVIKQYLKIGANCMIGAGAVVIKDVPDNTTVVGVPARDINQREAATIND